MDAGEVEVGVGGLGGGGGGGGGEHHSTYVSQLHQVFCSCDSGESGFLGRTELTELCAQLHLDDQTNLILDHLLGDDPEAKVDFDEFKEKFVFLLAQSVDNDVQSEEESIHFASPVAEREVSPKYFNGKKYGRRSRPDLDSNDTDNDFVSDFSDTEVFISNPVPPPADNKSCSNEHLDTGPATTINARSRMPSGNQIAHQGAKRRRRMKSHEDNAAPPIDSNRRAEALESLQQGNTFDFFDRDSLAGDNSENEEDYLKTIWLKLGVGADGFLNQKGLTRVCEHIGMEKMAEEVITQLFEKLDVDQDGKISFGEFLHLFRNGHGSVPEHPTSGTPVNTSPISSPPISTIVIEANDKNTDSNRNFGKSAPVPPKEHPSSKNTICDPGIFSCIDEDGSGFADPDVVVELWESLGVPRGYHLLETMGFNCACQICLLDLSNVLEDILQSSNDSDYNHVAFICFQHEHKFLKKSLEQMTIERDKLRADVMDANSRATMLAQEVDDHHAKLEKTSNNKIMAIEKKYQEQARHLKEELDHEREQLHVQMTKVKKNLEDEVIVLRDAEITVREQLALSQKENQNMELEMRALTAKLNDSQKLNQQRQLEAESMLALKQELSSEDRCKVMAEQLETSRAENKQLKDQNDELHAELESLRQQMASRLNVTSGCQSLASAGQMTVRQDCDDADVEEEDSGEHLLAVPTGGAANDGCEDTQVVPTARGAGGGSNHRRNGSWLSDYVRGSSAVKKRGSASPLNTSSEEVSDEENPRLGKHRRTISGSLSRDKSRSEGMESPTLVMVTDESAGSRGAKHSGADDPTSLASDGFSMTDDDEYLQLNPALPPAPTALNCNNGNMAHWDHAINKLTIKKVFAILRTRFIEDYERELEERRATNEQQQPLQNTNEAKNEDGDYYLALPSLSLSTNRRKLSDSGCDSVLDSQATTLPMESARTITPRFADLSNTESWWNRSVEEDESRTPEAEFVDRLKTEVEESSMLVTLANEATDDDRPRQIPEFYPSSDYASPTIPEVVESLKPGVWLNGRPCLQHQPEAIKYEITDASNYEPEIVGYEPEMEGYEQEVAQYAPEVDHYGYDLNRFEPEIRTEGVEDGRHELASSKVIADARRRVDGHQGARELHEVYQQELQSMDGRWKSILQAEKENWGNLVRNMERQYEQLKDKLITPPFQNDVTSTARRRDTLKKMSGTDGRFWREPEEPELEDTPLVGGHANRPPPVEEEEYDEDDTAEGLPDKIERTQQELEKMLKTSGGSDRKSKRVSLQRQSTRCIRRELPPVIGFSPTSRQINALVEDDGRYLDADDEDNGALSRMDGSGGGRKITSLGRSKSWRETGGRNLNSVEKRRFRFKRQGLHTGSNFDALCLDAELAWDQLVDFDSEDEPTLDYCGDSDYDYEDEDDKNRSMPSRAALLSKKPMSCAQTRFYEGRLRSTEKQKQSLERELGKVYNELLICKTSTSSGSSGSKISGSINKGTTDGGSTGLSDSGKSNCVIDVEVLHSINQHLKQQEKRCRHLEAALKARHQQAERTLRDTRQGYEDELERAAYLLHKTRVLLKEQTAKAKEQAEKLLQSDTLVKDLYIENAQLMKTLQFLEEKQHKYEKNNYGLQQKCSALNQLLAEMCRLPPT